MRPTRRARRSPRRSRWRPAREKVRGRRRAHARQPVSLKRPFTDDTCRVCRGKLPGRLGSGPEDSLSVWSTNLARAPLDLSMKGADGLRPARPERSLGWEAKGEERRAIGHAAAARCAGGTSARARGIATWRPRPWAAAARGHDWARAGVLGRAARVRPDGLPQPAYGHGAVPLVRRVH